MAGRSSHTLITDDDHGAILAIVTWCLGCALIFGVAVRIGTRFLTRHSPTLDDICIMLAVAFAIAGIIVASFAVHSGLGMRLSSLNEHSLRAIQKDTYIITILYVMTIGTAKLSVAAFLDRLAYTRTHRVCVTLLSVLILCWTATVTSVVVFACGLPRPWGFDNNNCIEVLPFWISASATDISTDVAMILLPINIVSGLDIMAKKKKVVMIIFAFRVILIILSFMRVVLLRFSLSTSEDISFDGIPFHAVTQAHSVLSILLACGPAFKPFLHNIRTSMLSSRSAKHRTQSTFGHGSYTLAYLGNYRGRAAGRSSSDGHHGLSESHGNSITERVPLPAARLSSNPFIPPRDRMQRPPQRPPSPPEELRPDLSIFGPRALGGWYTDTTVSRGMPEDNDSRISRASEGSEKSILEKTGHLGGSTRKWR